MVESYLHSPIRLHGVMLNDIIKHRGNYAFYYNCQTLCYHVVMFDTCELCIHLVGISALAVPLVVYTRLVVLSNV
jgi:hypothetical protein